VTLYVVLGARTPDNDSAGGTRQRVTFGLERDADSRRPVWSGLAAYVEYAEMIRPSDDACLGDDMPTGVGGLAGYVNAIGFRHRADPDPDF
jgi:hypothetical protein